MRLWLTLIRKGYDSKLYIFFMRCEYHFKNVCAFKIIDCDHKMWVGSMVSSWQWSLSSGLAKNSSTLFCYCYSLISYYFLGPFFQFKCQQKVICLKGIIGKKGTLPCKVFNLTWKKVYFITDKTP